MKTALTQLIEKWESELGSYIPNAPIYNAFIRDAKELLKAEKEQIIEAWESGYSNGVRSVSRGEPKIKSSEEYYNLTFKSDE